MIKGLDWMSFSVKDSKTYLEQAGADLRNMGCGIYYKKVQEVLTDSGTILLGAPMSMSKEEVDKVFNAELMKIKKGATLQGQWKLNLKFPKNMLQACCGRVKMIQREIIPLGIPRQHTLSKSVVRTHSGWRGY